MHFVPGSSRLLVVLWILQLLRELQEVLVGRPADSADTHLSEQETGRKSTVIPEPEEAHSIHVSHLVLDELLTTKARVALQFTSSNSFSAISEGNRIGFL